MIRFSLKRIKCRVPAFNRIYEYKLLKKKWQLNYLLFVFVVNFLLALLTPYEVINVIGKNGSGMSEYTQIAFYICAVELGLYIILFQIFKFGSFSFWGVRLDKNDNDNELKILNSNVSGVKINDRSAGIIKVIRSIDSTREPIECIDNVISTYFKNHNFSNGYMYKVLNEENFASHTKHKWRKLGFHVEKLGSWGMYIINNLCIIHSPLDTTLFEKKETVLISIPTCDIVDNIKEPMDIDSSEYKHLIFKEAKEDLEIIELLIKFATLYLLQRRSIDEI